MSESTDTNDDVKIANQRYAVLVAELPPDVQPIGQSVVDTAIELQQMRKKLDQEKTALKNWVFQCREEALKEMRQDITQTVKRLCAEPSSEALQLLALLSENLQRVRKKMQSQMATANRETVEKKFQALPEQQEYRNAVPKHEKFVFALKDAMEVHRKRAPWELMYSGASVYDNATGKFDVVFGGGELIGADGKTMFLDVCDVCGYEIQYGNEWGRTEKRFRCLDCSGARVVCIDCYEATIELLSWFRKTFPKNNHHQSEHLVADQRFTGILRESFGFGHLDHIYTIESELPVALRLAATEPVTLAGKVFNIFQQFGNRPCFSIAAPKNQLLWRSYHEVFLLMEFFCSAFIQIISTDDYHAPAEQDGDRFDKEKGASSAVVNRKQPVVALFLRHSPLYYVCELAAVGQQWCAAGLDAGWSAEEVMLAARNAHTTLFVCDHTTLGKLRSLPVSFRPSTLNHIVVLGPRLHEWINNGSKFTVSLRGDENESHSCPSTSSPSSTVSSLGLPSVSLLSSETVIVGIPVVEIDLPESTSTVVEKSEPSNGNEKETAPDDEIDWNPATTGEAERELPCLICFSSGTSGGTPKGVVDRSERWWFSLKTAMLGIPYVAASVYSSAWATDKIVVWKAVLNGARIGFSPWDKMGDIIATYNLVRPTAPTIVPAMLDLICMNSKRIVAEENQLQSSSAHHPRSVTVTMNIEGEEVTYDWECTSMVRAARAYAYAAIRIYRELFGGRCTSVGVGGAKVPRSQLMFLKETLPCLVTETYGATEIGGIGMVSHNETSGIKVDRGVKIKLIDRPELGYTSADLPFPRGEVAVKSQDVVRPTDWVGDEAALEAVRQRYDDEGYIRTGDIVQLRPDGSIEIIGRASALVKLGNSQFVSPERIEAAIGCLSLPDNRNGEAPSSSSSSSDQFSGGRVVIDIAISDSLGSVVCCIVEPSEALLHSGQATNKEFLNTLLSEIQTRCREAAVSSAAIPKVVVFDTVQWSANSSSSSSSPEQATNTSLSPENTTRTALTGSMKICRPKIIQRARTAIKTAVADYEQRITSASNLQSVSSLPEGGGGSLTLSIRTKIFTSLGFSSETNPTVPLRNVGVDSLLSAKLWAELGWLAAKHGYGSSLLRPQGVQNIADLSMNEVVEWFLAETSAAEGSDGMVARTSSCSFSATAPHEQGTSSSVPAPVTKSPSVPQHIDGANNITADLKVTAASSSPATQPSEVDPPKPAESLPIPSAVDLLTELRTNDPASSTWKAKESAAHPLELPEASSVHEFLRLYEARATGFLDKIPIAEENKRKKRSQLVNSSGDESSPCAAPRNVLITGANGYLGRFLVQQAVLRENDFADVCVFVRGRNDHEARLRLSSVLPEEIIESKRLQVFAADVTLPKFGLQRHSYEKLQQSTQIVIHAAAMVKHWPLNAGLVPLLDPNAGAMLNLVTFISESVSNPALCYVSTASCNHEDLSNDIHNMTPLSMAPRAVSKLGAYGCSKYVGEYLASYASNRLGFPLGITRPCLLTWPTEFPRLPIGEKEPLPKFYEPNREDWLIRLVDSVSLMGIRPQLHPEDLSINAIQSVSPVDECAIRILQYGTMIFQQKPSTPLSTSPVSPTAPKEYAEASVNTKRVHYPFDFTVGSMRLGDLLAVIPKEIAHPVPPFAFCAAARQMAPPPPFFPLLHLLGTDEVPHSNGEEAGEVVSKLESPMSVNKQLAASILQHIRRLGFASKKKN